MSHFAEIDSDNIVQRVIVISQENIDTGNWGNPSNWIQTSYNTRGGKHYDQDGVEDSGVVILRIADSDYSGTTSGSPTVDTSSVSDETILIFNSSGSYTA